MITWANADQFLLRDAMQECCYGTVCCLSVHPSV